MCCPKPLMSIQIIQGKDPSSRTLEINVIFFSRKMREGRELDSWKDLWIIISEKIVLQINKFMTPQENEI